MIWKKPTQEVDWAIKTIMGNTGQTESYGMLNGPLTETLSGRMNFALRNRDGVIKEIGDGRDLDGLGVKNFNGQIQWDPNDKWSLNIRHNGMRVDRPFGGANGGGLVVLNEEGIAERNFDALVPGYRRVDPSVTDPLANNFLVPNRAVYVFTDPNTGEQVQAQNNRAGIDFADFDGFQNAAALRWMALITAAQNRELPIMLVFSLVRLTGVIFALLPMGCSEKSSKRTQRS